MGIGRRLFHLLRANVGHHWRRASGSGRDPWAAGGATDVRDEARGAGGPPPGAAPVSARRRELERRYAALELPWGEGPDAIRRAHRRLLRRFHPDRFARDAQRQADATRLTQELTAARDALLAAIERGEIVPRPGPSGRGAP